MPVRYFLVGPHQDMVFRLEDYPNAQFIGQLEDGLCVGGWSRAQDAARFWLALSNGEEWSSPYIEIFPCTCPRHGDLTFHVRRENAD